MYRRLDLRSLSIKKPKTPSVPVNETCPVRQKRATTFQLCKFPHVLTKVAVDMSDRSDFPRLEGTNITIYTSALKRALVGVGQVDQ